MIATHVLALLQQPPCQHATDYPCGVNYHDHLLSSPFPGHALSRQRNPAAGTVSPGEWGEHRRTGLADCRVRLAIVGTASRSPDPSLAPFLPIPASPRFLEGRSTWILQDRPFEGYTVLV